MNDDTTRTTTKHEYQARVLAATGPACTFTLVDASGSRPYTGKLTLRAVRAAVAKANKTTPTVFAVNGTVIENERLPYITRYFPE